MSQISRYPISKNIANRIFEIFLATFTRLKNKEQADQFISDLLTPTEKVMLAKRLAIAFLLERNYDYRTIQGILRVSTGTIRTVSIACKHGSEGYKKVIDKILREEALLKLFDNAVVKLLAIPAGLEKERGAWAYLKRQAEKQKMKNKKAF